MVREQEQRVRSFRAAYLVYVREGGATETGTSVVTTAVRTSVVHLHPSTPHRGVFDRGRRASLEDRIRLSKTANQVLVMGGLQPQATQW